MGVKTKLTLKELNLLFSSYKFTKITPTSSGIIDTTYLVYTQKNSYILKKYERDIEDKIKQDTMLLKYLKSKKLNVSTCRESAKGWYLYEKLDGLEPRVIKTFHIQELARFLAKFHNLTYCKNTPQGFSQKQEIAKALKFAKKHYFYYYKKLEFLKSYKSKNDGLIHGDIFKDNTVFNGTKLGVFDFIDSFNGDFCFDAAVCLLGFDVNKHKKYFFNLFLNTYNQNAVKKLKKQDLQNSLHVARCFYVAKRIYNYKNTLKAKELL